MKISAVKLFKHNQAQSCLREKFGQKFAKNISSGVNISGDMDKYAFTQLSLLSKEIGKIAKREKTEITFMEHPTSDQILMNIGPYTTMMDWRIYKSDLLETINSLLAKCKQACSK